MNFISAIFKRNLVAGVERFGCEVWKAFNMVFDCLPLAAVVGKEIFCCHGGLSPDLHSLNQIKMIKRPLAVPEQGQ